MGKKRKYQNKSQRWNWQAAITASSVRASLRLALQEDIELFGYLYSSPKFVGELKGWGANTPRSEGLHCLQETCSEWLLRHVKHNENKSWEKVYELQWVTVGFYLFLREEQARHRGVNFLRNWTRTGSVCTVCTGLRTNGPSP